MRVENESCAAQVGSGVPGDEPSRTQDDGFIPRDFKQAYIEMKERALEAEHQLAQAPAMAERVKVLEEALHWALPLADLALEAHRIERLRCGHDDMSHKRASGETWVGLTQSEWDQREKARAALASEER